MGKIGFKHGVLKLRDYANRNLELSQRAWKHIIEDRGRDYFERLFDNIVLTLASPDEVRESTKEKNVVIYERFFDDFYVANTVLGRAYINVVVNWSTGIIRTVYPSQNKRQKGKIVWQPKR
jgi:hypothetical protein